jgi:hypothetical protein
MRCITDGQLQAAAQSEGEALDRSGRESGQKKIGDGWFVLLG